MPRLIRVWIIGSRESDTFLARIEADARCDVTRPGAEQAVLLRFVPETVIARDVSYAPQRSTASWKDR
jgi:hypothetical protein